MAEVPPPPSSIDPAEVARFSALASRWWAAGGAFAALHQLNPARLAFIRETALARFGRPGRERRPLAGLRLLDIGCGGGLVCEPMARLGFSVTGMDADAAGLAVARAHASEQRLAIDYRQGPVEGAAGGAERWDVVLALEVIEHVAQPSSFLTASLSLVAPGGLLVLATINRTAKSLLLAKFGAEYVLRWAPRGTHDWRRFLTPAEIVDMAGDLAEPVGAPAGLTFDPARLAWRRSADPSVNYMIAFGRPACPEALQ